MSKHRGGAREQRLELRERARVLLQHAHAQRGGLVIPSRAQSYYSYTDTRFYLTRVV